MEDLLRCLRIIGYEGPLVCVNRFHEALERGPKSTDFTTLVAWLSEQLSIFGNFEERVHPTAGPEDSSSFLLELNTFLKELGSINTQFMTGNMNQRLGTRQERMLLLEHLIHELMANKIIDSKRPDTRAKLQVTIHESDTARNLKDMLIALEFGKPPDNINTEQLFTKLDGRLKTVISSAPKDLLGKPLIMGELSNEQWEKIDQLQQEMMEEFTIRREMLLKRLDVTVQSFLWSDRIKVKEHELTNCYHSKRDKMSSRPSVTISQLLAARDDLAIIEKTSSAAVRKNTQSSVTKVIIGAVPDRGGRPSEQAPPPPEMPSWQKNRVPDAPRGGRGGGWGGGRGGGRGEGREGGGNYRDHKNASSNFGQNRDWQDQQSNSESYQEDCRGGGYHRGGFQRGARPGGYKRAGRGGRVQGGWAQGDGGYDRGKRSRY
ncbi:protein FAM98A [Diachasmimorpha longicaudata]|uniref:protein FAM98A n=1 Tax=Diachasmimorpha longicaudata TaxID=58733 RepID=UPI0030B87DCE